MLNDKNSNLAPNIYSWAVGQRDQICPPNKLSINDDEMHWLNSLKISSEIETNLASNVTAVVPDALPHINSVLNLIKQKQTQQQQRLQYSEEEAGSSMQDQ